MHRKNIDWPFLIGGLLIGSALMGFYIHESDSVDWKVLAVISTFTLGIIRGRQWFNTIVSGIRAWRDPDGPAK